MIDGVKIKDLKVHCDERGNFAEIVRQSEKEFGVKFAQLSFSKSFQGVSKAWHMHNRQTDWVCTIVGDIKYVMHDTRRDSKTYKKTEEIFMGETLGYKLVKVPPGVAHGYKIINGPAYVVYMTSEEYNPQDELRIPHDDKTIGYDWNANQSIK